MSPTGGLIAFLLIYALVGAAFAFNVWRVSDRFAEHYRGKPWLVRQIGRDNPDAWRGGGLIMLAFGIAMAAGILLLGIWHPPAVSPAFVIVLLATAAVACVVMLVQPRHSRPASPTQPPDTHGRK